jgi:hypothetical protein
VSLQAGKRPRGTAKQPAHAFGLRKFLLESRREIAEALCRYEIRYLRRRSLVFNGIVATAKSD